MTFKGFLVRSLALVFSVSAMVVSAVAAAALVVNGFVEGVLVASVFGGVLVALFLRWTAVGRLPPAALPDPFKRDLFSADIVNVAHIRVAGIGGLCLVFAAAAVMLELQLITVAMTVALVGGVVTGVSLIAYRRHHVSPPRATF
jgi:drug/metabolite transporter (DMT)-like permease